jgi:hypothetical protein
MRLWVLLWAILAVAERFTVQPALLDSVVLHVAILCNCLLSLKAKNAFSSLVLYGLVLAVFAVIPSISRTSLALITVFVVIDIIDTVASGRALNTCVSLFHSVCRFSRCGLRFFLDKCTPVSLSHGKGNGSTSCRTGAVQVRVH